MVKGVISQLDSNSQGDLGVVHTDTSTEDASEIDIGASKIPLQMEAKVNFEDEDVPDLVSPDNSSDDESEYLRPEHVAYIDHWMKQPPEFREGESKFMCTEAIALFLLGTDSFTPALWVRALHNSQTLTAGREKSTSIMTDKEWEIVEILLQIIDKNQTIVKDKGRLKDVMTMIIQMEANCTYLDMLDTKKLLDIGKDWTFFGDARREVEGLPNVSKYSEQTSLLLIYFYRLVCQNIYEFGKEGRTLAIKLEPLGEEDQTAFELKHEGDGAFRRGQYAKAISYYDKAIETDFANHYLFQRRGEAYFHQQKYIEAYCDFRRAMILDKTSQEGYYNCAKACLALHRLDEAQMWNAEGLNCDSSIEDFYERLKRQQGKFPLIRKELEQKNRRLMYEKLTKEALRCVLVIKDLKEAHRNYKSALEVFQITFEDDSTDSITVLMYAYGITAAFEGSPGMLKKAHKMFASMQAGNGANSFPLIFFGLSYVLVAENRFQEALKYLEAGLRLSRNMRKKWKPVCWPSSNQVIEESQLETYQKLMENMLKKCRPFPVAEATPNGHKEDSKFQKYEVLTADAMEALHHADLLRAYGKFQAAYDLMSLHQPLKESMSNTDIVTLRYACGITAVSQDSLKPLQEGLDIFLAMLREELGSTFPLVYYGLGKAFIVLYRFAAALKYIDTGMSFSRKVRNPICWPGSKEIIEESRPKVYQQQMEAMRKKCRYPPIPDAVCSAHISDTEKEAPIYFSDPSFSGIVRLECYRHCRIAFHPSCWLDFKTQVLEKTLDKELVNHQCPTPDCGSVVRAIQIGRPGHNKEFVSANKPSKIPVARHKVLKMPKSNQEKIARQAERKERRRRKRQEARAMDTDGDLRESKDKNAALFEKNNEMRAVANPAAMTVLKKEDENDVKYQGIQKQVKQRKKKEKVKQLLNVEVNFTDKDRSTLLGEHSLADDVQSGASRIHSPLSQEIFAHGKPGAASLAELVAMGSNSFSTQTDEAITENLYEYFGEILEVNGPLSLSDSLLRKELSCLPPEAVRVIQKAGGPPRFLRQCLKFVVIDEIVANIADTRQAHELARGLNPSVMLPNLQKAKPLLPNPDIQWSNPKGSTLMEPATRPVLLNGVFLRSTISPQLNFQPNAHDKQINSEIASNIKKDSFNGIGSNKGNVSHTVVSSSQPVPLKLLNHIRGLGATYSSVSSGSSHEDDDDGGGSGGESVEKSVSSGRSKGSTRLRSLSGSLNPSAPEFKPGHNNKEVTPGNTADNFSCEPDVKPSGTSLLENSTGLGARRKTVNSCLADSSLDKKPKTCRGSIDDLDDFMSPITKDIKSDFDDVDDISLIPVTYRTKSGSFRGLAQHMPEPGGVGSSRPGSRSDISETIDMSVDNLFRTSSPSSSGSSFKVSRVHDSSSYLAQDLQFSSLAAEAGVPCNSVSPVATLHERKLSQASINSSALPDWKIDGWSHGMRSDLSEKVQMGESASTPPLQTYTTSFGVVEESKPAESVGNDDSDPEPYSDVSDKHSTAAGCFFAPPGSSLYRAGPLVGGFSHPFDCEPGFEQGSGWLSSVGPNRSSSQPLPSVALMTTTSSIWSAYSSEPVHAFPSSSSGSVRGYPSALYLSSASTWSENTFPSAIRPDENPVNLRPMSLDSLFPPGEYKTQSSSSIFDSEVKDSDDEGKKWRMDEDKDWDVTMAKNFADKEVQAGVPMQAVGVNTEVDITGPEGSSAYLLEENRKLVAQVQVLLEDKSRLLVALELHREKNRFSSSQAEALQHEMNEVLMQNKITIEKLSAEYSRKEQQTQDIINHLESKSSKMESECNWLKQHLQAVEEEMQSEKSRAREAEIETVKMRQQVALMQLEFKRKEAEFHQHCVSKFAHKCEERGETVPEKMKEVLKYWEDVLNAFRVKEAQVRREFEVMMSQVRAGKHLSELPQVSISPPPMPKMPEGAPMVPANGQLAFTPYQMNQQQLRPSPTPSPPVRTQSTVTVDTVSVADAKAGAPLQVQNSNSAPQPPSLRAPRPLVPPKGLPSMPLPLAAPRLPVPQPPAPVVTQASFAAAAVRPILRPPLGLSRPPSPLTMVTTSQTLRPQQPDSSAPAISRVMVGAAGNAGRNDVAAGHARILSSGQTGKQSSFEKLVNVLQKNFPSCSRNTFTQLIQELRRTQGGSLSGMSLEVILTRLTQMAIARGFKLCGNAETLQAQPPKQSSIGTDSKSVTGPPPGISLAWGTEGLQSLRRQPDWSSVGVGDNFEEEDPCAICHEELSSALITTLDCHHQFHDECIRRWFKEQTTCPNCRVHSLLQDDFPALK